MAVMVCVLARDSVGVTEDLPCLGVVLSRMAVPEIADVSEYESLAIRTLFSVGMGVANTGSGSGCGGTGEALDRVRGRCGLVIGVHRPVGYVK